MLKENFSRILDISKSALKAVATHVAGNRVQQADWRYHQRRINQHVCSNDRRRTERRNCNLG